MDINKVSSGLHWRSSLKKKKKYREKNDGKNFIPFFVIWCRVFFDTYHLTEKCSCVVITFNVYSIINIEFAPLHHFHHYCNNKQVFLSYFIVISLMSHVVYIYIEGQYHLYSQGILNIDNMMYDGIISLDNIKKISVSYFIINAIV